MKGGLISIRMVLIHTHAYVRTYIRMFFHPFSPLLYVAAPQRRSMRVSFRGRPMIAFSLKNFSRINNSPRRKREVDFLLADLRNGLARREEKRKLATGSG